MCQAFLAARWCQRRETLIPEADADDYLFSFFFLFSSDFCLFTNISMVLFAPGDCFSRHILAYFIWFWWEVIHGSTSISLDLSLGWFSWFSFIPGLKKIMGLMLSFIGWFLISCLLVLVGCYTCLLLCDTCCSVFLVVVKVLSLGPFSSFVYLIMLFLILQVVARRALVRSDHW